MIVSGSGGIELAAPGPRLARCYGVVDLGVQPSERFRPVRKVLLCWEILDEDRMSDGRPFGLSRQYSMHLRQGSKLREMLESWRGRALSPEELRGFDLRTVLGAYCTLSVKHMTGTLGQERAVIDSVMGWPKGATRPPAVNKDVYFSLDDPECQSVLPQLPEWVQERIAARVVGQTAAPKPTMDPTLDDDIPF